MTTNGARRFYEAVSVVEADDGYAIALDQRSLRTPAGAKFVAPSAALAALCAEEWAAQGAQIAPASMPVTQLAFAAIDWTRPAREERAAFVAGYAQTDLCCHRAPAPQELVDRQHAHWQPVVDWAARDIDVRLPVVTGVIAADAPHGAVERLLALALALDDFRLTALTQATAISGSALIGFAMIMGQITAEDAFAASALDDLWALERWGEDEEARARLTRIRGELAVLVRFIEALS